MIPKTIEEVCWCARPCECMVCCLCSNFSFTGNFTSFGVLVREYKTCKYACKEKMLTYKT